MGGGLGLGDISPQDWVVQRERKWKMKWKLGLCGGV